MMLPGVSGIGSGSGYPKWTAWFGCSSASYGCPKPSVSARNEPPGIAGLGGHSVRLCAG